MRAIAYSIAAALVLVGLYLALGGASYAPAKVADPCAARSWRNPQGFEAVAEQIVLSALDGAACQLHVSREDMVLALANRDSREQFVREHNISNGELESIVRTGLKRSIDDAQNAGALNPTLAGILRGVVGNLPIDELLDLLQQLRGL
jgi:IS5 family transposase